MLLLHLPDNLSRHRGMEIDCVVPQALSCLVTLTTTTFEWFADTNLCSVTILGVVLDAIHILWRRQRYHGLDGAITSVGPGNTSARIWMAAVHTVGGTHGLMHTADSRQFQTCLHLKMDFQVFQKMFKTHRVEAQLPLPVTLLPFNLFPLVTTGNYIKIVSGCSPPPKSKTG